RIRFNGAGKAHGYLTYRPFDYEFYLTAWASAFDDHVCHLRTKGKMIPVAGIDIGASGTPILACVSATVTWDPGSVASGASTTTTISLTGCASGDTVLAAFTTPLAGLVLTG